MTEEQKQKKMTKHEFYFETALYDPVFFQDPDSELFFGTVDAYNSLDGFDTTYNISEQDVSNYGAFVGFKRVVLTCKRGGKTELRFFVLVFDDNNTVMKVGQYPSLADIQFAEIGQQYEKHLSKEDLRNYKKAIGLYAHGAGAGSFVYLRRIFENLILEAYTAYSDDIGVSEVDFRKKRMTEKVESLKKYLPSQLLEMKSLYSILSNGVHELSEEKCLMYFSPIKLSIQLILNQKIEQEREQTRNALVKKELQKIHQTISSVKKEEEGNKK